MTYIHNLLGWPEFTWDTKAIAGALAAVRHKQGKHLGKMEAMGFDLRTEASLTVLTDEIVKSSAIEGESLNSEEVRSSIARKLGLDVAGLPKPGREVEGVVDMERDQLASARPRLAAAPTARGGDKAVVPILEEGRLPAGVADDDARLVDFNYVGHSTSTISTVWPASS